MNKETQKQKKSTNPIVWVGVGCLVLIVLLSVGSFFVANFVAKKASTGLLQKVIEDKTGIKTNLNDIEEGKMTFTDEKTGATINVGGQKVPDTFPKDFPLYPGAEVTSSLTGSQDEASTGYWLTLTTKDELALVTEYYKKALPENGWTISGTFSSDGNQTLTVKKDALAGTVVSTSDEQGATQIAIVLGTDSAY